MLPLIAGCSSIPVVSSIVSAPNITGEWVVVRPKSTFTMNLFENSSAITGSSGTAPYTFPVNGSRSGNKVTIGIWLEDHTVTYSGDLSSDGKQITGTIGGDSTDTFTANKKQTSGS